MLPKKVKKRASLLAITLLISVTGIFFILQSLNKNILYFKSPTDIKNNQNINFNKKIRVGGMVKKDSLGQELDQTVQKPWSLGHLTSGDIAPPPLFKITVRSD